MILDTNFVIDLMKGEKEASGKLKELKRVGESLAITTITIFELWSGLARSRIPKKEKERIRSIIKSQMVIDLDKKSAEKAGEIDGALIKQGKRIDPEDSLIAGIALTTYEKILTRDDHFRRIHGLDVEIY